MSFTNGLADLVGLRIEALPHDSLPAKGPGRADDGNFVLTEVIAKIKRLDATTNALSFNLARADFEQSKNDAAIPGFTWSAASVIGGHLKDEEKGWAILPQTGQPHQLVLGFSAPLSLQAGETLDLNLKHSHAHSRAGAFSHRCHHQRPSRARAAALRS